MLDNGASPLELGRTQATVSALQFCDPYQQPGLVVCDSLVRSALHSRAAAQAQSRSPRHPHLLRPSQSRHPQRHHHDCEQQRRRRRRHPHQTRERGLAAPKKRPRRRWARQPLYAGHWARQPPCPFRPLRSSNRARRVRTLHNGRVKHMPLDPRAYCERARGVPSCVRKRFPSLWRTTAASFMCSSRPVMRQKRRSLVVCGHVPAKSETGKHEAHNCAAGPHLTNFDGTMCGSYWAYATRGRLSFRQQFSHRRAGKTRLLQRAQLELTCTQLAEPLPTAFDASRAAAQVRTRVRRRARGRSHLTYCDTALARAGIACPDSVQSTLPFAASCVSHSQCSASSARRRSSSLLLITTHSLARDVRESNVR